MKVGLIGCGKIAANAHVPALTSIDDVELVALSDLNEKVAKKIGKKFGIDRYFADYRQMLKEPDIDIIDICTPTHTHAPIAIAAANHSKHILIEKPLAYSLPDALQMVEAAKSNGVNFCVVQNFRYFPAMQKIKNFVKIGRLGRVLSIEGTCHQHFPLKWSPKTWWFNDGGIIYDVGIHLIDAILWLMDSPLKSVYAVGGDQLSNMHCINHASVLMEFTDKRTALCDFSWLTGRTIFKLDLHGTGGHISSDLCFNHCSVAHGVPTPIDDFNSFSSKMKTFSKDLLSGDFFSGSLAYHKPLIQEFVRNIKNQRKEPVTGREGLQVLATAVAIKQSIETGEKVRISDILPEFHMN